MLSHKLWSMAQIGAEWVLYVLLFLSLVSVAIIVERAVFFWRHRTDIDWLRLRLRNSLKQGGLPLALQNFAPLRSPDAVILCEALQVAEGGADAAEEVAAGIRGQEKLRLEKGLVVLGTLGNNAPFIGLFGTVLGIINAFRDLSQTQLAQAGNKIMSSISEALVATAVGLLLAIPAVIAFNYFQSRVKSALASADTLLHDLLGYLRAQENIGFAPPVVLPSPPSGRTQRKE